MELNPAQKRALLIEKEEWCLETCPRHLAQPSSETAKTCELCEAFLFICPGHEAPPCIETRECCEDCKERLWTLELCSKHSSKPCKRTRKDCDICKKYLCGGCNAAPAKEIGKRKQCDGCVKRYKNARTKTLNQPNLRRCTTGQHYRPASNFIGEAKTCRECVEKARLRNRKQKALREPTLSNVSAANTAPQTLGKWMREPYRESIRAIFQEISEFLQSERGRSMEPDVSDLLKDGYIELARHCNLAGHDAEDLFAKIATLAPEYLGIPCGHLLPGEVEIISADGAAGCSVLAISDEQLRALKCLGKQLPDSISVLLIPAGARKDDDDTFDLFRSQCKDWKSGVFEYQQYVRSTNDAPTGRITVEGFLNRIEAREQRSDRRRLQATGPDPMNILNLSARMLGSAFREPDAISLLRYRLLSLLSQKPGIPLPKEAHPGKESVRTAQLMDLEACLKFLLFGERGCFSSYHMDILNGTWVQCKTGLKLWLIYCGEWDETVKSSYGEHGLEWRPAPGSIQGILLRPGDTLIMRPGYPVIHAVLTIEDTFMTGGMIWSENRIGNIMANLEFILTNMDATNEQAPRQLPQILDRLDLHVKEHLVSARGTGSLFNYELSELESVESLIRRLKELKLFQCECKDGCPYTNNRGKIRTKCPCKANGLSLVHHSGCTVWCHSGRKLNARGDCRK